MKNLSAFFLAFSLLLSGCASLRPPTGDVYPFRAAFEGQVSFQGVEVGFSGALSVVSRDRGYAQIYGPVGLVVYTLDIFRGKVAVYDLWGKQIKQYSLPAEQFLSLIAGVPPDSRYLWKRTSSDSTSVTYTWGNLRVDEALLPRKLHIRGDPPTDAVFSKEDRTIGLMMTRGSDTLHLSLSVIEGGRWGKGSFTSE